MKTLISSRWFVSLKLICLSSLVLLSGCATNYAQQPNTEQFIQQMVAKHNFDQAQLTQLFSQVKPNPKVIKAMTRPSESYPWYAYRPIFITPLRIQQGVEFWQQHTQALAYASHQYGVSPEIIVAILGVETTYGRGQGGYSALDALSTLAFSYPPRARYFTGELEQYLLLSRELPLDASTARSSYAGALGAPQFMPSSYRHYAVAYDGQGLGDLFHSSNDAIVSVANYFKANGWQPGGPVAKFQGDTLPDNQANILALQTRSGHEYWLTYHNFNVIKRYNSSPLYAMAVYQLSTLIKARMS